MIDSLILMVVVVPLQMKFGVYSTMSSGEEPNALVTYYGIAALGMAVFLGVNIPLWSKRAQSVGKIAVGIRIVDEHGNPASLSTIVFKRTLPIWAVSWIPVVGSVAALIDPVAILGKEKMCVHDRIANTRVIRV